MSRRHFSDWLQAYLEYTEYSEAPAVFHFWAGVHTVAGALRRKTWIEMGYFQWYPNFYIIFVAPPGIVSKSTTLRIGQNLLRQLKGIHFGPEAITWQALVTHLAESTEGIPLANGTFMPMSALSIASGEFGTFLNPHDREMVDILVALWDGQTGIFEKKTKTSGHDRIENPWLNIAACTTPAWIQGNFPEYLIGGGFTSRCIFVYASKKRRFIAYPSMEMPKAFKDLENKLVEDLRTLSLLTGEFHLTPEAVAWGTEWYEKHYAKTDNILAGERFAGYWARKQTHMHKLAMILSAAQGNDLIISAKHLESAEKILTVNERDMPHVFSAIGADTGAKKFREIMQILLSHKIIKKSQLFSLVMAHMSFEDFEKATSALIQNEFVFLEQKDSQLYLRPNMEKLRGQNTDGAAS